MEWLGLIELENLISLQKILRGRVCEKGNEGLDLSDGGFIEVN